MWLVTRVHEVDGGVPKVDVLFEGEKKAETCVAESLVRVTVRKSRSAIGSSSRTRMASSTAMRATGKSCSRRAFSKGRKQKTWRTTTAVQAKAMAARRQSNTYERPG